jgi:trk system potassium uptake protein TrkA
VKRFAVIGLGNFGAFVASRLYGLGYDVIAIDRRPEMIDRIGPQVTRAVAGDGTKVEMLRELGVRECDAAIISTGDDMGASILALLAVHDLKVQEIYVKVHSDEHRRIADALGATESIFPEREAAASLASRLTSSKLLRYVELGAEFGLQEMAVPNTWEGRTLRDLELRTSHDVQVVAVHDVLRDTITIPDPDRALTQSDTLLVAGAPDALQAITRLR